MELKGKAPGEAQSLDTHKKKNWPNIVVLCKETHVSGGVPTPKKILSLQGIRHAIWEGLWPALIQCCA